MKITKDKARSAIERFYCSITLGFPPLETLYSIETEGKAAAELRGYDFQSIRQQIDNGPGTCLVTRAPLNILTLSPAKKLFSLVLAMAPKERATLMLNLLFEKSSKKVPL